MDSIITVGHTLTWLIIATAACAAGVLIYRTVFPSVRTAYEDSTRFRDSIRGRTTAQREGVV